MSSSVSRCGHGQREPWGQSGITDRKSSFKSIFRVKDDLRPVCGSVICSALAREGPSEPSTHVGVDGSPPRIGLSGHCGRAGSPLVGRLGYRKTMDEQVRL